MDLGHPAGQMEPTINCKLGKTRGAVVVYACRAYGDPCSHDGMTQSVLARKLAAIKGYEFAGEFDSSYDYADPLYFVPSDTLVSINAAHELGIRGEQDLFGGVVPFAFAATKIITHALPEQGARAPEGWSSMFSSHVEDAVLPGYSAFTVEDARSAGCRLLRAGALRIKKPHGVGGLGQTVVSNEEELDAYLGALDMAAVLRDGLVLEQNLNNIATLSVGQVRVGELVATYHGIQRLTRNNSGEEVYGGSKLFVARGDFNELFRLDLPADVRTAIAQARTYHAAAMTCFPGIFVSRCNYDIAQGFDGSGRWRSGVLEQSWRMGGASGAELAAIEAFQADPELNVVCASTTEVYGANPDLPADVEIYFSGVDERVGAITKYSRLESYVNT
jgi:hypothetical protein